MKNVYDFLQSIGINPKEQLVSILKKDRKKHLDVTPDKNVTMLGMEAALTHLTDAVPVDLVMQVRQNIKYRMRYQLNLKKNGAVLLGVCPYESEEYPSLIGPDTIPLDAYLLPIMTNETFDLAAEQMIQMFGPAGRTYISYEDAPVIAKNMALRLEWDVPFADPNYEGIVTMDETLVELEGKRQNYSIGHILISSQLTFCSKEWYDTVFHECAHAFLDILFFALQRMMQNKNLPKAARTRTPLPYQHREIEIMERQARKLPAHLLLPEQEFREAVSMELAQYQTPVNTEIISRVIETLAAEFQVSQQMTKIRMKEIGFPQAEGVKNYVNGRRIPDYGVSGLWPENTTYTISVQEMLDLYLRSEEFKNLYTSGKYVYIDGHVCKKDSAFLGRTTEGKYYIRHSSRNKIDLFCVAFHPVLRGCDVSSEPGKAFRERHAASGVALELGNVPQAKCSHNEKATYWIRVAAKMPVSAGESLSILLELVGKDKAWLSQQMGVSPARVSTALKSEHLKKRGIIGPCIVMQPFSCVTNTILRHSNAQLDPSQEEDAVLDYIIHGPDFGLSFTIKEANQIMYSRGLKAIVRGEMSDYDV